MVVVAILAIVGAAAFGGFRQDEFRTVHKRLVADMEGAITTGRNWALDEQTRVRLTIDSHQVEIRAFNQTTNTWDLIENNAIDGFRDAVLLKGNAVCILGMQSGVQTPAQAVNVAPPTGCLAATQQLIFEPDGSFTDDTGNIVTRESNGVTLWIQDARIPSNTKYGIIQVFPGGLVRSIERLGEVTP